MEYIKDTHERTTGIIQKYISHSEFCKEIIDMSLDESMIYNILSCYKSHYMNDYREMPMNDFIDKHKNGIILCIIKSYFLYMKNQKEEMIKALSLRVPTIIKSEEPLSKIEENLKNNKPIKIKD